MARWEFCRLQLAGSKNYSQRSVYSACERVPSDRIFRVHGLIGRGLTDAEMGASGRVSTQPK